MAEHITYDYIVCGGGTAGCVVAARLAENPKFHVLLIEAGSAMDANMVSRMPADLTTMMGTAQDWNITNQPLASLDGRAVRLNTGKRLGGTSAFSATLCIRGMRQDYDDWDIDGWTGDEMFQYMSKAELFIPKPGSDARSEDHGSEGPLQTTSHDPMPISDAVLRSFQSMSLPLVPDLFSTGLTPNGSGHVLRSITIANRCSSSAAYFLKDDRLKGDLVIMPNTLVEKIEIAGSNGILRAVGVKVKGSDRPIYAREEIILSAGVYGSPAVLLRSGIGPASEAERHGVHSKIHLPGVGQNLMDHMMASPMYEVVGGLTSDFQYWHPGGRDMSRADYIQHKACYFSQFPFGTFAYARLDERLSNSSLWNTSQREEGRDPMGLTPQQPHVEIWNTENYSPKAPADLAPTSGEHAFGMCVALLSPRSRGQVALQSSDPTANPIVDHNYLHDPLDMLVLSEACQMVNDIVVKGEGTKNLVKGSWPRFLQHHNHTSRGQWEHFIRRSASTSYHPAGTCKMGSDDDPMAVLDSQLQVRGVQCLRVADASVMPKLISGAPQMAIYAIAEKAADMIKAEYVY